MARHDKSILVVDDDAEVLSVLDLILQHCGFDVTTAGGPADALSTITSGRAIDLLLTDVMMPGPLDGFGLARAAKTHLPRLEVIYISGWIENAPRQELLLGPLLRKPSDPETICKAARQLLGVS